MRQSALLLMAPVLVLALMAPVLVLALMPLVPQLKALERV